MSAQGRNATITLWNLLHASERTLTGPGCVKTKKWPSTIVFKPSKFSDEARSLTGRSYRLHG